MLVPCRVRHCRAVAGCRAVGLSGHVGAYKYTREFLYGITADKGPVKVRLDKSLKPRRTSLRDRKSALRNSLKPCTCLPKPRSSCGVHIDRSLQLPTIVTFTHTSSPRWCKASIAAFAAMAAVRGGRRAGTSTTEVASIFGARTLSTLVSNLYLGDAKGANVVFISRFLFFFLALEGGPLATLRVTVGG